MGVEESLLLLVLSLLEKTWHSGTIEELVGVEKVLRYKCREEGKCGYRTNQRGTIKREL